ncbi:SEC-C metal-binding domain-containing protein [Streptomyces sp. TBY4]|uniref:SEC-C metal-binding domain-containing protein n=1 Tax=Streptomyces sp. TBY4 TaxID=2962030 RepID=UPI0020B7FC22|nr:SEC-C metal-binding domain-containing protein [Streptomyces sp. TBY4]MCP3756224.1 SEC-C metal-binding domain-containing protein [Streptomyces sp. TBY4]
MRPDTPAEHIAEAERLIRTATRYPEDQEPLLLQAAAHLELADERERASALYDQLLAADTTDDPSLIKALQAANLWEYGHEPEARALIQGIRAAAPSDPAPWEVIAEALETHDELEASHECFTEAATLLAPDNTPLTPATTALLTGRHRVRRLLGLPHDDWDMVADTRHIGPIPLDELHDPKRIWALGSDDPAELRAEIARLRAELGDRRAALSRPFPVAILHWPARELAELLTSYPTLSTEYPSHDAHLAQVEAALRTLTASGTTNLGIVTASVPSYEAFAASEKTSPSSPSLLAEYATTLAARGKATPWPPTPTTPCWCTSGRAYGTCHGSTA